jgi:formate dehydrogenase accessory protein FdhE
LRFAAGLLRAQEEVAEKLHAAHASRALTGDLASEVGVVLGCASDVLRFAAAREDERTASARLLLYWNGDRTSAEDYFSRAVLRPYVEALRELGLPPKRDRGRGRCPYCGGAPAIGRRRGAEAQGAVRSLLCGLCGFEWETTRIVCPACAEDEPKKLPVFTSPSHPLVRIEACETCRRYVKFLDTTLDERIVPEVDDLLSLSLDLWAVEQGFERLEPGLAG